MLCTFCPPTILGDFYRISEKSPKLSADKTSLWTAHASQKIRPSKRLDLYIFQIRLFFFGEAILSSALAVAASVSWFSSPKQIVRNHGPWFMADHAKSRAWMSWCCLKSAWSCLKLPDFAWSWLRISEKNMSLPENPRYCLKMQDSSWWSRNWLFAQKPFDPPNRPKPPQIFLKIRRCPENPRNSHWIHTKRHTKPHWIPLNFPEFSRNFPNFPQIRPNSTESEISGKSGEERNSRNQPLET